METVRYLSDVAKHFHYAITAYSTIAAHAVPGDTCQNVVYVRGMPKSKNGWSTEYTWDDFHISGSTKRPGVGVLFFVPAAEVARGEVSVVSVRQTGALEILRCAS